MCQKLQAEVEHLERLYNEKRDLLRASASTASVSEYRKLRLAESEAKSELETAREGFESHRRTSHPRANGYSFKRSSPG